MKKNWLLSYLALGVTWGASFLFIEKSLTFLTPVGVAFSRCFLGSISLWIILVTRKIIVEWDFILVSQLWIMGLLLNVFPGILFAYAQEHVSSILAGIINALTPIMSVIMIMVVFRNEKLKFERLFGIVLGFVGVFITLVAGNSIGEYSLSAVLALILAVLCYGISYPFSSRFITPRGIPSEFLATTQVSLSAITLLPFFIISGIHSYDISTGAALSIFCLGVLGTGVAYIWNFRITQLAGAAIASTVTYLTPIVAVVLGLVFLGEPLTWNEPLGGLIVLVGSAITQGRIRLARR